MEDPRDNETYEEELLDYEEEEEKAPDSATKVNGDAVKKWVFFFFLFDLFRENTGWLDLSLFWDYEGFLTRLPMKVAIFKLITGN